MARSRRRPRRRATPRPCTGGAADGERCGRRALPGATATPSSGSLPARPCGEGGQEQGAEVNDAAHIEPPLVRLVRPVRGQKAKTRKRKNIPRTKKGLTVPPHHDLCRDGKDGHQENAAGGRCVARDITVRGAGRRRPLHAFGRRHRARVHRLWPVLVLHPRPAVPVRQHPHRSRNRPGPLRRRHGRAVRVGFRADGLDGCGPGGCGKPGDVVAVQGCGAVGQRAVRAVILLGAERVIPIDRVPERLETTARHVGGEGIGSAGTDVGAELRERTGGRGPDVCIEAVGTGAHSDSPLHLYEQVEQQLRLQTDRPAAVRQALHACRKGGTVFILGVLAGAVGRLPLGAVINKGLADRTGRPAARPALHPDAAGTHGGRTAEYVPSGGAHRCTGRGSYGVRHVHTQVRRLRPCRHPTGRLSRGAATAARLPGR